jgi:hypothetical protein
MGISSGFLCGFYFALCGIQVSVLMLRCSLGVMQPERLSDVADGSSNVREVWKFSVK